MPASRRLKRLYKSAVHTVFSQAQRIGVDLLPRHFYSEIPDLRVLRAEDHWKAPYSMIGVDGADPDEQLAFVQACCPEEVVARLRETDVHGAASRENGEPGYGPTEADLLYAYVTTHRPAQIVQVGCGVSTAICLRAARDAGYTPSVVCIDPYPTAYLRRLAAEGAVTLVEQKVQTMDLAFFDGLGADVFFFVDSTHTLGPSGEVSRLVVEILPRLQPGVVVHFHDILFPYDYDRNLLTEALFFQHESILLHAFLVHNARFAIAASLSMLHYARPHALREALPHYRPAGNDEGLATSDGHFPSALYLHVR